MEHIAVFEEQVVLTPKDMRDKIESIENRVRDKLQARLEGRCSRHGYVVPGTIKVLSRSMGSLEKGRFTGSFIFHVQAEGTVLNPSDGTIIKGEVIRKNKMGMYVSYEDAIRVIIPRDLHIGDEAFEGVEIGETVEVEIKKSRFQVNDPYILSVGTFRSSTGKKAVEPKKVANTIGAPGNNVESGLNIINEEDKAGEAGEAGEEAGEAGEEAGEAGEAGEEADEADEDDNLAAALAAKEL
jgi:DNA-directed RNA polymerase subunit E'/Rpb7